MCLPKKKKKNIQSFILFGHACQGIITCFPVFALENRTMFWNLKVINVFHVCWMTWSREVALIRGSQRSCGCVSLRWDLWVLFPPPPAITSERLSCDVLRLCRQTVTLLSQCHLIDTPCLVTWTKCTQCRCICLWTSLWRWNQVTDSTSPEPCAPARIETASTRAQERHF